MPRTHGMGKGKGPRPKSKERWEKARTDDGTAARKLLILSELVNPRESKWNPIDKTDLHEIYDRFVLYLQFCELHDLIPFWIGFCNALGYDKATLSRWFSGEIQIPENSRNALRRIHELFQQNIVELQAKGEIRDIVGMFWLKALDPAFWAVEITKSNNIQVNVNVGNGESPEQLQEKFIKAIEVPYTEGQDKDLVTLPCPDGTRDLKDGQTYNECVNDGQLYTNGGR